ncbi:MAG: hypothetical protein ACOVOX_13130, partial [Burkholderiaceae bacterium]
MHISTRIQRCWSQLSCLTTKRDEDIPGFLKTWIAGGLSHVSSRVAEFVASSSVMQFILRTPVVEVPL